MRLRERIGFSLVIRVRGKGTLFGVIGENLP